MTLTKVLSCKICEIFEEHLQPNTSSFNQMTFFTFQFNYCSLVWMDHSRSNNSKIKRFHQRCLKTVYKNKQSSFTELSEKDVSVSIHKRNIQILAMEMYKISQGLSRPIMQNVFNFKSESHYTLRQIFQSFKVYVSRNWDCFTSRP